MKSSTIIPLLAIAGIGLYLYMKHKSATSLQPAAVSVAQTTGPLAQSINTSSLQTPVTGTALAPLSNSGSSGNSALDAFLAGNTFIPNIPIY